MLTKKEIREDIHQKLKSQEPALRQDVSRQIQNHLCEQPEFQRAHCLLIYLALPEEVDTVLIVERCLADGKRVVVPRMNPKTQQLDLREIRNLNTDLETGSWGVREPRTDQTQVVNPQELDYVIVPGLAFDKQGHRLGRGKGYFDKLLSCVPNHVPRVGLAFPCQILDQIPLTDHDQSVHIVLSS